MYIDRAAGSSPSPRGPPLPAADRRMKRHPSLVPLSHDHHDILVVAQGLVRGRPTAPRSDWPTNRRAQADRVLAFYRRTLQPHFAVEETDVFPLAARRLPGQAGLLNALRRDHDDVRSRILALPARSDEELAELLPALGALLETHVRTEERVLFEALQQAASASELDRLGSTIGHRLHRTVACAAPAGPDARSTR